MNEDYRKRWDELKEGIKFSYEEMEAQLEILKESGNSEDTQWLEKFTQRMEELQEAIDEACKVLKRCRI